MEMAFRCSAVGCASGTDALVLGLMALDVGPGDEVVTTPYSFFATAGAVVRLGARPVFADIDPATGNVDLRDAERKITSRTKVFLPVHLFGQTVPLEEIRGLCAERGVTVVEDAAQAFGAWRRVGDRIERAGVMGSLGCYSFFPTKNLGGCGDGGMVVTRDAERAERLRRLRVHGEGRAYVHEEVGLCSRLDALQAAVLDVKLPHLERWNTERRLCAPRSIPRWRGKSTMRPAGPTPRTCWRIPSSAPRRRPSTSAGRSSTTSGWSTPNRRRARRSAAAK